MVRNSILLSALIALTSSAGSAAILTQTYYFDRANAQVSSPFSGTIDVQKFDSTGLTPGSYLVGIEFQLGGNINGTQKADNDDGVTTDVTLTTVATLSLRLAPFGNLVVTIPTELYSSMLGADDGGTLYTGADSIDRSFSGVTDRDQMYYDSSYGSWTSLSNAVSGPGNLSLSLLGSASTSADGAGNINSKFTTFASADGYVRYYYESPVPEPGTYVLIGGGLAIVGLIGRRNRRSA